MLESIAYFFNEVWPVHMFFAVQLLLAECMFLLGQNKRSHPVLRIGLATVFYLLICWFHPLMGHKFLRVLCIFGWSILYLAICIRGDFKCCLFIALASYAIQNLGYNLGDLITSVFHDERDFWFYLIAATCFFLVYLVCYVLLVRQFPKGKRFLIKDVRCFVLAVITIIVVYSKNLILSLGILTDYQLLVIFTIIGCVLVLVVQFDALRQSEMEEEKYVIQQLLEAEKKRLDQLKENIDIVNLKCHDLRYHINQYRKSNIGEEHEQFFREIEQAVGIYDHIARTGNSAIDVLLSEKLLFCNVNGIEVSYMVDETVLAGLEISDIYSLFGNALDNAIQSVMQAKPEQRIISMSVKRQGNCGQIVISNYCETPPAMADGLPVSSGNPAYHGFGMRSIRYIVEKYKGSLLIDVSDQMFTLSIILPEIGGQARGECPA